MHPTESCIAKVSVYYAAAEFARWIYFCAFGALLRPIPLRKLGSDWISKRKFP
jgi:hypothetical protein